MIRIIDLGRKLGDSETEGVWELHHGDWIHVSTQCFDGHFRT